MTVIDLLYGTPWWAYAIFFYLLIAGIRSLSPSNVSLLRLIIVPFIFISWSLYSLSGRYSFVWLTVKLWLIALAFGAFFGWLLLRRGIRINHDLYSVHLPGSWYPLVLYMTFFALKYCIGVSYALSPELQLNQLFWMTDSMASGAIAGIFTGRLLYIVRQYLQTRA